MTGLRRHTEKESSLRVLAIKGVDNIISAMEEYEHMKPRTSAKKNRHIIIRAIVLASRRQDNQSISKTSYNSRM